MAKSVMKIQPCTVEKKNHCYIWWLKREKYVSIIQNYSWVLRKNWKKWELSQHVRYISGIPGLPFSACTPFLISSSASSSLLSSSCWRYCSGRVSQLLPLLVGSLFIDRRWRGKKGCRRAGYKKQRTFKILQGNFLYMRSVVSQWSALQFPEVGRE